MIRKPGSRFPKDPRRKVDLEKVKPLPAFDKNTTRRTRDGFAKRFRAIVEKSSPTSEPVPPVYEPSKYGDRED